VSWAANIQLSSMNISPSSMLIFFTPMGFSCCSLCLTLSPRFAWTSSSGKYFRCWGTLCGHCDSSAASPGVAAQRAMIAGGRASRCGRCIVASDFKPENISSTTVRYRCRKKHDKLGEKCGCLLVVGTPSGWWSATEVTTQVIGEVGMRWRLTAGRASLEWQGAS